MYIIHNFSTLPYTQYTSLIHQCCHILKPVAFFGKQPARLVRQGGGGGVWTDHWEWKKGWFHFLTIFRIWGHAVCCQVHRWRCAMWVYQNNRWPPAEMFSKQIFHSQRSISPAFMGQEAKILIWIGFTSAFCKNPDINLCNFICCHKHENTTIWSVVLTPSRIKMNPRSSSIIY